jgi:AcrR family transcriptional regulator
VSQTTAAEPPITARRAQTRERLMTAARTVFAERGIPGASVEEICEAAGFTRGAFYSNFADKSALALAMIQHRMATQYAAAERAVEVMKSAGDRTPEELLAIALTAFELSGSEEPRDALLADRELLLHAARDPELRAPYLAFVEDCMGQIAELVGDAVVHAGLEFTVPIDRAVHLLAATHDHLQALDLLGDTTTDRLAVFGSLVTAITVPTCQRLSGL